MKLAMVLPERFPMRLSGVRGYEVIEGYLFRDLPPKDSGRPTTWGLVDLGGYHVCRWEGADIPVALADASGNIVEGHEWFPVTLFCTREEALVVALRRVGNALTEQREQLAFLKLPATGLETHRKE